MHNQRKKSLTVIKLFIIEQHSNITYYFMITCVCTYMAHKGTKFYMFYLHLGGIWFKISMYTKLHVYNIKQWLYKVWIYR